jgi:hypothetical protein
MKNKTAITVTITVVLLTYITAIVVIDPYNYFNTLLVSQDVKKRIAYPLNERLSKIIEYKRDPLPNILIGDSRIQNLSSENIKRFTNEAYFNFGYGGCTLPELIDSFWFATKHQKLKNVCIGISFDMYNKYNNTDYFKGALKSASLFNYIFNSTNFKVLFYMIKDCFSSKKIVLGIPKITNMDQFWLEIVEDQTNKFYKVYKYPDEFFGELIKIKKYCNENNINLFFFIPPTYIDLQTKIDEFALEKEKQRFEDDIKSIGKVYDFNYASKFTRNKENFFDPFHSRRQLDTILIKTIFIDSTYFSKLNE